MRELNDIEKHTLTRLIEANKWIHKHSDSISIYAQLHSRGLIELGAEFMSYRQYIISEAGRKALKEAASA